MKFSWSGAGKGAASGAATGSMISPGWGTAIGALAGGALGGLGQGEYASSIGKMAGGFGGQQGVIKNDGMDILNVITKLLMNQDTNPYKVPSGRRLFRTPYQLPGTNPYSRIPPVSPDMISAFYSIVNRMRQTPYRFQGM